MRLTATRVGLQYLQRNERSARGRCVKIIAAEWRAEHRVARIVRESGRGRCEQRMRVRRKIVDRESDVLRSWTVSDDSLGQSCSGSRSYRYAASQIGKRECGHAIAAEDCSQQRKEGLVIADRQQLALARHPSFPRKVPRRDGDLAEEGKFIRVALRWQHA